MGLAELVEFRVLLIEKLLLANSDYLAVFDSFAGTITDNRKYREEFARILPPGYENPVPPETEEDRTNLRDFTLEVVAANSLGRTLELELKRIRGAPST